MKQELYVNHSIVWLKGSTKVFTKPKKKKKKGKKVSLTDEKLVHVMLL